jgi:hypothetical protein
VASTSNPSGCQHADRLEPMRARMAREIPESELSESRG